MKWLNNLLISHELIGFGAEEEFLLRSRILSLLDVFDIFAHVMLIDGENQRNGSFLRASECEHFLVDLLENQDL